MNDAVDQFYGQLRLAQLQADKHDFASAYLTLANAYDNLLQQHEDALNEILALRKKVSPSK